MFTFLPIKNGNLALAFVDAERIKGDIHVPQSNRIVKTSHGDDEWRWLTVQARTIAARQSVIANRLKVEKGVTTVQWLNQVSLMSRRIWWFYNLPLLYLSFLFLSLLRPFIFHFVLADSNSIIAGEWTEVSKEPFFCFFCFFGRHTCTGNFFAII